ncbi:hypothetical protein V8E36_008127, partial [Tilletia maclaganii]
MDKEEGRRQILQLLDYETQQFMSLKTDEYHLERRFEDYFRWAFEMINYPRRMQEMPSWIYAGLVQQVLKIGAIEVTYAHRRARHLERRRKEKEAFYKSLFAPKEGRNRSKIQEPEKQGKKGQDQTGPSRTEDPSTAEPQPSKPWDPASGLNRYTGRPASSKVPGYTDEETDDVQHPTTPRASGSREVLGSISTQQKAGKEDKGKGRATSPRLNEKAQTESAEAR